MAWKVKKRRKGRYRQWDRRVVNTGPDPEFAKMYADRRSVLGPSNDVRHKKSFVNGLTLPKIIEEDLTAGAIQLFAEKFFEERYRDFELTDNTEPRLKVLVRLVRKREKDQTFVDEFNFVWLDPPTNTTRLFFSGDCYVIVQLGITGDYLLQSHTYGARKRALRAWEEGKITWVKKHPIP